MTCCLKEQAGQEQPFCSCPPYPFFILFPCLPLFPSSVSASSLSVSPLLVAHFLSFLWFLSFSSLSFCLHLPTSLFFSRFLTSLSFLSFFRFSFFLFSFFSFSLVFSRGVSLTLRVSSCLQLPGRRQPRSDSDSAAHSTSRRIRNNYIHSSPKKKIRRSCPTGHPAKNSPDALPPLTFSCVSPSNVITYPRMMLP